MKTNNIIKTGCLDGDTFSVEDSRPYISYKNENDLSERDEKFKRFAIRALVEALPMCKYNHLLWTIMRKMPIEELEKIITIKSEFDRIEELDGQKIEYRKNIASITL